MAFIQEHEVQALAGQFVGSMVQALAGRAARPMVENGGRDEAPFAQGLVLAAKRGGITAKQSAHIVRLYRAYCAGSMPVMPSSPKADKAVAKGSMRAVVSLGDAVIKTAIKGSENHAVCVQQTGLTPNQLEYAVYLRAQSLGIEAHFAPCFLLPSGQLVMMAVTPGHDEPSTEAVNAFRLFSKDRPQGGRDAAGNYRFYDYAMWHGAWDNWPRLDWLEELKASGKIPGYIPG